MKGFELSITNILFVIVIVIVLLSLILSMVKEVAKFKNTSIIYLVVTALCAGVTTLTCFIGMNDHISMLILIEVLILITGILHVSIVCKLVLWTLKDKFLWKFLFSIATVGLGTVFFMLIYSFLLKQHALQYILLTSLTWFFVPFLFIQAFNRYLAIPSRLFKKWHYPVGKDISDLRDSEMVSLLVVSFVFHKKMNALETTFGAKAPPFMVFERLFYYFINIYNERHWEEPIEYLDKDDCQYGWVFHYKANWFGRKCYINSNQINTNNYISENSIIIYHRFKDL